jgi:hypothetical protein
MRLFKVLVLALAQINGIISHFLGKLDSRPDYRKERRRKASFLSSTFTSNPISLMG